MDVAVAVGFSFTVHGAPITQGSKTRTRWALRESNAEQLAPWREAIKYAAMKAVPDGHSRSDAYAVSLTFTLRRPLSAPKGPRRRFPIAQRSGDIDKLSRAVLDALTDAGVWMDDAQCVTLHAAKRYVNDPSAMMLPGVVVHVARYA